MAALASGAIAAALALLMAVGTPPAYAAQSKVGLGTAAPFAVLAGTEVTNAGPTVVSGDLGISPDTSVTGFPPGEVINGTQHVDDAVALDAQNDLTTAYDDAANRSPATTVVGDLAGQTLVAGVYSTAAGMDLNGTVTLDGEGDPDSVFIFQAGSDLITGPSSTVALIRGAQACHVFWQVGSSATLDTDTTFKGTIMALTSITLLTDASVDGRVLARNGAVALDTNTITRPTTCLKGSTGSPSSSAPPSTPPGGSGGSGDGPGDVGTDLSIPVGHPSTGRQGPPPPARPFWWALAALSLTGSGVAGATAWRRHRVGRPTG